MNWYDWYAEPWKKYAQFSGRARRKEFCTFSLINPLINILILILIVVLSRVLDIADGPVMILLVMLLNLAMFIPQLACAVRRLHDSDKSGWWILIGLVPFVLRLFMPMLRSLVPSVLLVFMWWLIGLVPFGVLLFFLLRDGTPGANKYGVNPKESAGKSAGSLGRI